MASIKKAQERRDLANNPGNHPKQRRVLQQMLDNQVFGTTTTTTSTTTTTTTS